RAFQGDSWMEVLANRLTTRPPAPHAVNAAVSQEVSALAMQLLAEQPAQRPGSAAQVARRLKALEGPPAPTTTPAPRVGTRRRWWPAALLVSAAAVLLVWLLWPGQPKRPDTRQQEEAARSAALTFAGAWHEASPPPVAKRPPPLDSTRAEVPK